MRLVPAGTLSAKPDSLMPSRAAATTTVAAVDGPVPGGAYELSPAEGDAEVSLFASGSEVAMALAAKELASKLKSIDHLNVSPELLGPLLANLVQAGTRKLEA